MIHLFKYCIILLTLMEFSVQAQEVFLLGNRQNECDVYCFKVLKPMLGHIGVIQNRWEQDCNEKKIASTQTRLDKIEEQMQQQQEKDKNYGKALEETKQKLMEQKELIDKHENNLRRPFQKVGSKYYYVEQKQKLSWFAAAHRCTEFGAHLVSVNSQKELNELVKIVNTHFAFWTDINDLSGEGEFLSLSTGTKAAFLKWSADEPNNARGGEHCVNFFGNPLRMNDMKCDALEYFICESYAE